MPGARNDDNVNWFAMVAPVLQLCVQQDPDGNELQRPPGAAAAKTGCASSMAFN